MWRIVKETEISHSGVNLEGGIWWKIIFDNLGENLGVLVPATQLSAAGTDPGSTAEASRQVQPGAILPLSLSLSQLPPNPRCLVLLLR